MAGRQLIRDGTAYRSDLRLRRQPRRYEDDGVEDDALTNPGEKASLTFGSEPGPPEQGPDRPKLLDRRTLLGVQIYLITRRRYPTIRMVRRRVVVSNVGF